MNDRRSKNEDINLDIWKNNNHLKIIYVNNSQSNKSVFICLYALTKASQRTIFIEDFNAHLSA